MSKASGETIQLVAVGCQAGLLISVAAVAGACQELRAEKETAADETEKKKGFHKTGVCGVCPLSILIV